MQKILFSLSIVFSLIAYGDGSPMRLRDLSLDKKLYTAEQIESTFVASNNIEGIVQELLPRQSNTIETMVSGFIPKYVTNAVEDIMAPAVIDVVYSNATVVATNIFNVTPYVMNSIKFRKGDETPFDEYSALDTYILEARNGNHNYSVMLDQESVGEGAETLDLDFTELFASNRVFLNIPTNDVATVKLSQDKLPIILRMDEPQKGYVIVTIKSLKEIDSGTMRDLIRFTR